MCTIQKSIAGRLHQILNGSPSPDAGNKLKRTHTFIYAVNVYTIWEWETVRETERQTENIISCIMMIINICEHISLVVVYIRNEHFSYFLRFFNKETFHYHWLGTDANPAIPEPISLFSSVQFWNLCLNHMKLQSHQHHPKYNWPNSIDRRTDWLMGLTLWLGKLERLLSGPW